jgi:hypothetical protein
VHVSLGLLNALLEFVTHPVEVALAHSGVLNVASGIHFLFHIPPKLRKEVAVPPPEAHNPIHRDWIGRDRKKAL